MLVISYLGLKTPNHNMMIREWPSFQTHLLMSGCEGLAQHVRVPTRLGKPGIWKWSWKIEKVMGKSSFCRWIAKISVLRRVADKSTWSQKGLNISVCLSWLKNGHGNKTKMTWKSHGFFLEKGGYPVCGHLVIRKCPIPGEQVFFYMPKTASHLDMAATGREYLWWPSCGGLLGSASKLKSHRAVRSASLCPTEPDSMLNMFNILSREVSIVGRCE